MAAPAPDLTDMNAMLQVAIAAARAAGAHMKSHLSTSRVEKTKSSKDDLVTFLGEENVEPGSEASARALRDMVSKEWLWIVDPIDGTTNFVHHRPASVVSVACAHLGEVVVGVIYDPYRDEIFTAQKGKGTFLNGQPAHVSQEASFSEALVGFGIGTKDSVRLPMLDCAREFSAKCRGLRLQGAAAIELAWTAAGRQSEAGGEVTNSDGTPFSLSTRNIVVSNNKGDIHASMIELIKKADAVNKSFTLIAHSTHHSPSQSQFGQDGGAVPAQYHVSTWFFVCGPLAVNTFLLGLAANLHVFKKNNLAFDRVMDMRPDEIPTAGGVFKTAFFMCLLQFLLFNGEAARRGDAFGVDETRMEMLLLGYVIVAASLLLCPFDVLHYKFRMFVLRKLARCFWPFQQFSFKLPTHATPFIEVFMADGMTSLSKFIQDLSVALMLLVMSFTSEPEDLRESYISKLKESPLPYFAASTPYIIRATQCLISFQRTPSVNDRFLHLLNTMKYCSSLLVISVGAYPMLMGLARPEQSSFFLLCAVFNSLYSFLWDVVMDWGLGQPKLPRRVAFLRHQLIYRPRKIYYLVIVVDFVLRIMWVAKWWDWMHRGVHFKLVAQVAEVVRRIVWNFVRVEWQCIKLDILATKKLSADTVELDEMIEKVPLMQEHEDDLEDMKPRMRTLSRPNSFSAEASGTETSSTLSQSPLHDNTDSELFLQVDAESSSGRDVQRDEMIAPAAITVASYPEKPQAMLVSYGDAHQRWESSPNKATTEGAEADEL
ncbi:Inositol monophosphatase, metal-binding site [Phytophthora cactorum]|nr:Inositol monophosphatase, metal-binding site [Phytophthora cactorum]